MLKTLIVDDESSARKNVRSLLQAYRPDDQIFEAKNTSQAMDLINRHEPQLMFLDIEMPGETGIELLRKIHKTHPHINVVFITAYSHFAIEAIKCEAFDYILKPVIEDEFIKTLKRLESRLHKPESESGNNLEKLLQHFDQHPLKIKTKRGIHFINPEDIVYIKSQSNYSELIDQKGCSLLISKTLAKVEEMLPGCQFLRVGRSHIINKKYLLGTDRISKHVKLLVGENPVTLELSLNDIRKLENCYSLKIMKIP